MALIKFSGPKLTEHQKQLARVAVYSAKPLQHPVVFTKTKQELTHPINKSLAKIFCDKCGVGPEHVNTFETKLECRVCGHTTWRYP